MKICMEFDQSMELMKKDLIKLDGVLKLQKLNEHLISFSLSNHLITFDHRKHFYDLTRMPVCFCYLANY